MNFSHLGLHSHYSLGKGLSKPEHIARRLVNCGYKSGALTDHGSVSGVVDFASAMKNACKSCGYQETAHNSSTKICSIKGIHCEGYSQAKLKPIFGNELYVCKLDSLNKTEENSHLSRLSIISKNKDGWKHLIKLTSKSNQKERFHKKPRLSLIELSEFSKNGLICLSGRIGSELSDILFLDKKAAYLAESLDDVRMLVKPDWEKQANDLAGLYQEIFGKENFFIQINLCDQDNIPASIGVAQCLRKISKNLNIPCIADSNPYYSFKEQATDQRILLCAELDTTFDKVKIALSKNEDFGMSAFFKSNNYYIQSTEEMLAVKNTTQELENAFLISEMCDSYSIENRPFLPKFVDNSSDRLFDEAYLGLTNRKISGPEYMARFQKEIRVLNEAGLADYFLIVQDYVKWAKSNGIPVGPARGSCAGSLIAYLTEITEIDPIPSKLIFERFYNDGRNTKDKVSLPDIDVDFSKNGRKKVIEYVKNKYGENRVCGIATFNRMKGRGALKAVFSAYGKISFDQMNIITNLIPEPAKVSGEIQETLDEFGEASLIEYAIENEKKLKEYCFYNDDGELDGPFARDFAQAIRLEDTKTHCGKHAAGIIISSVDLDEMCPMILDSKGNTQMCGFEMTAAEKVGLVKLDFLGIAAEDKLKGVQDLLFCGRMEKVQID